jgi:hypothetical protein
MRWEYQRGERSAWNRSHRWGRVGRVEWDLDTSNRNRLSVSLLGVSEELEPGDARADEHAYLVGGVPQRAEPMPARPPWKSFRNQDDRAHVSISWSNGNSDPVWALYFDCWVPRSIGRRLPR